MQCILVDRLTLRFERTNYEYGNIHYVEIPKSGDPRMHCIYQNLNNILLSYLLTASSLLGFLMFTDCAKPTLQSVDFNYNLVESCFQSQRLQNHYRVWNSRIVNLFTLTLPSFSPLTCLACVTQLGV